MENKLSDKKLKLIENLGLYFEKSGLQPASARIYSLLIISNTKELSFDEIMTILNMSKSATSNAINILLQTSKLEFITKPGVRKRFFRCKVQSLKEGIRKFQDNLFFLNVLLGQVLELRLEDTNVYDQGLDDVISFIDFIIEELNHSVEKWENSKK